MILGEQDVTRRRRAVGTRAADGRWSPGAASDSTIRATVQPLNGRDIASLPEGERESDQRKVYTKAELRPASQHDGLPADLLSWDAGATWYEVRQVERQTMVIPHYKARVLRQQEAE